MTLPIDKIVCKACGCTGIHACLGKPYVAISHIGHVTHSSGTVRVAVHDVLMGYQRDTAVRFNRDQCMVCGAYHNNGNLPCPTMQVTAHG